MRVKRNPKTTTLRPSPPKTEDLPQDGKEEAENLANGIAKKDKEVKKVLEEKRKATDSPVGMKEAKTQKEEKEKDDKEKDDKEKEESKAEEVIIIAWHLVNELGFFVFLNNSLVSL